MAVLIRKKSGSPILTAGKLNGRTILGGDSVNTKVMDWYEQVIDTTLADGTNDYTLSNNNAFFTPSADISWGDGSITSMTSLISFDTHTYASAGTYNVRVVGNWRIGKTNSFPFSNAGKVTDVLRWGQLGETGGVEFTGGAFRGENGLGSTISAPDQPYVDNITSLSGIFRGITNTGTNVSWFMSWTLPTAALIGREFLNGYKGLTGSTAQTIKFNTLRSGLQGMSNANPDVSNWDVSGVTDMRGICIGCNAFTGVGLPNWDISSVQDLYIGFQSCSINQDLSGWDFSSVTDARNLFQNQQGGIFNCGDAPATNPNTPGNKLVSWNFPNAVILSYMFAGNTGFNQNMPRVTTPGSEAWDFPATLTNIGGMFFGCTNFNGDIDNWNVSNIRFMNSLFYNCDNFTRDLSGWDVSNVESMASIFQNSSSPMTGISTWTTSSLTSLHRAFAGTSANPDITGWDTSGVTTIYQMVYNLGANFTRDLSGWNTESLEAANVSLFGCQIDFSFGDWNLQNATTINAMARQSTISDANVADSLEGWYKRGAAPATGINAAYWCGNATTSGRSMSQTTYADAKTAFDALTGAVSSISTGTNTSVTASKLVDSAADFVTDGVAQYDWVKNTTSGETAIVLTVDNSTTLSLTKDIFKGTGASYEVGRNYGWDMTGAINWV